MAFLIFFGPGNPASWSTLIEERLRKRRGKGGRHVWVRNSASLRLFWQRMFVRASACACKSVCECECTHALSWVCCMGNARERERAGQVSWYREFVVSAVADFCCSCESAKKVAHVHGAASKCIQSKQQSMSRHIIILYYWYNKKKTVFRFCSVESWLKTVIRDKNSLVKKWNIWYQFLFDV